TNQKEDGSSSYRPFYSTHEPEGQYMLFAPQVQQVNDMSDIAAGVAPPRDPVRTKWVRCATPRVGEALGFVILASNNRSAHVKHPYQPQGAGCRRQVLEGVATDDSAKIE